MLRQPGQIEIIVDRHQQIDVLGIGLGSRQGPDEGNLHDAVPSADGVEEAKGRIEELGPNRRIDGFDTLPVLVCSTSHGYGRGPLIERTSGDRSVRPGSRDVIVSRRAVEEKVTRPS